MRKIVAIVMLAGVMLAPLCALPWEPRTEAPAVAVEQEAPKGGLFHKSGTPAPAVVVDDGFHIGIGIGGDVSLDGDLGVDVFGTVRRKDWLGILGIGYTPIDKIGEYTEKSLHGFAGIGYEF